MLMLFRTCAGRVSVGAWRSRKYVIWSACVMALVFLLYVQYSPSSMIGLVNEPQQHRSLHAYRRQHQDSYRKPQRVSFVDNDYIRHDMERKNADNEIPHNEPKQQDQQQQQLELLQQQQQQQERLQQHQQQQERLQQQQFQLQHQPYQVQAQEQRFQELQPQYQVAQPQFQAPQQQQQFHVPHKFQVPQQQQFHVPPHQFQIPQPVYGDNLRRQEDAVADAANNPPVRDFDHFAAPQIVENARVAMFPEQPNNKQQSAEKQDSYVGQAAADWNGGSYRYNGFGEPVYNHGNRPNYIPKERVIHLDFKGAPPLPSTYKNLIPWLAKYGATAVLIEYEDMFPWRGSLAPLAAKNHYTKEDIKDILSLCKANNIEVIPLVQTFGHLEYALKLPAFSFLREVPQMPQALCPSKNESLLLAESMIDQIMKLHPGVKYLHIGCDEVYQLGECEKCRMKMRENLFLDHVSKVAKYVRETHKVIPIIWHDMLSHVSEYLMKDYQIGQLVEPMVWVYAEDVYRFVQPSVWSRFAQIFPTVWAASAFKGAFGEQSTVPNVQRHLDNNLNWLDVMASEGPKFTGGFRGLVLTGWQRHDHFAVLCELIPSALPSLAVNLAATSHGYFNETVFPKLYESLKCMQTPKYQTGLNLDSDPFLWDKFSWCFFDGALIFKSTARLDAAKKEVQAFIKRVTQQRAWITDYNRRHNFSSPMRIDEDLEELPARIHTLTLLIRTMKEALSEWFDEWTTGEWIEQHIWPLLNQLETLRQEAESMKKVKTWPARPLPLLPELEPYGIKEPKAVSHKPSTLQEYNKYKKQRSRLTYI